jgi:hypothetical protein
MTRARRSLPRSTLLIGLAAIALASSISPRASAQKGKPKPPPAPTPAPDPPPAPAPSPAPAAEDEATKNEAKQHFERGLELLSEEAYDAAYAEFSLSRKLFPTKAATKNAGICLRRLKRYDEALDMFEAMAAFTTLNEHDRAFADKEIASLRAFVGTLQANGGEAGAVIAIDGRERGTLPLSKPLRVSAGSHVVRVFKSGYAPFEKSVEIVGGQNLALSVSLQALAQSGRLAVTEQSGKPAQVVIDNVVVGQTPWEGTVAVGDHAVVLRGEGDLATQPAVAKVRLNESTPLGLALEPLTSTLRVEPTPVNALVIIDGVPVGRGIWEGRLRAGGHKLEVVEEGFFPTTLSISIANAARSVEKPNLERDTNSPLWKTSAPSRFVIEAKAGGAFGPSFGGDVTGGDGASSGLVVGALGRASLGYELGVGLGFSVDAGYAWTRQNVSDRNTTLSPLPVGSSPNELGKSAHELTARGPVLGAGLFFHRGDTFRWTLRLGGGLWLASVADRRGGVFTTSVSARPDGSQGNPAAYNLDVVEQTADAQYAYVAPEARIGLPLGKHAEVALGVEGFVALALSQPAWDPLGTRVVTGTCRANAGNDCVTDGLAVFDDGKLTGKTFVLIVPGISFRYEL